MDRAITKERTPRVKDTGKAVAISSETSHSGYLKDGPRTAKPKEIEAAIANNELQEWADDN